MKAGKKPRPRLIIGGLAATDADTSLNPIPRTPAEYLRQRARTMRIEARQLDELVGTLPVAMDSQEWGLLVKHGI
jgi:hypothetical protein